MFLRDGNFFSNKYIFIPPSFLRGVHISCIPVTRVLLFMYHVFILHFSVSDWQLFIICNFKPDGKNNEPWITAH